MCHAELELVYEVALFQHRCFYDVESAKNALFSILALCLEKSPFQKWDSVGIPNPCDILIALQKKNLRKNSNL